MTTNKDSRTRFVRACRGESVDRAPVWLMRQAGRYLPEYRQIRERASFLEMCRDPALATEVSLQPIRRFGMDAAVVFSDILLPLTAFDLGLDFRPGPILEKPVVDAAGLRRLKGSIATAIEPTCEAIAALKRELGDEAAVVGFAGAPWTLAAYLSESPLSRDLVQLNRWTYQDPKFVEELLDRLADIVSETLRLQIEAGADAIQIFDTWAGVLSAERFEAVVARSLRAVIRHVPRDRTPVILYARGAVHLVDAMVELEPDVLSLDWRTNLGAVAKQHGQRVSLQGNFDPAALSLPPDQIQSEVMQLLEAGRAARGHILNLGHGVQPQTPVEGVEAFVRAAQSEEAYSDG